MEEGVTCRDGELLPGEEWMEMEAGFGGPAAESPGDGDLSYFPEM